MSSGGDRKITLSNVSKWSCSFTIDGIAVSDEVGDVRLCCSFEELEDSASATVVMLERIELPTAPATGMLVLKDAGVPANAILRPDVGGVGIEWHTARRKRATLYDPWICAVHGGKNVNVPTPQPGIFALRARLVCGTQSNQVEYAHSFDERMSEAGKELLGPNKAGKRNHYGVAATQLLLGIRNAALA